MSIAPISADTCTIPYSQIIDTFPLTPFSLDEDFEYKCRGQAKLSRAPLPIEAWLDIWKNGSSANGRTCLEYFRLARFDAFNVFDEKRMENIRLDFTYMFSKLFLDRSVQQIIDPSAAQNNIQLELQSQLMNACFEDVGACEDAQRVMCTGCTRAEISSSDVLRNFCGCHAPRLDPTVYKDVRLLEFPECDPLCVISDAAKLVNNDTGFAKTCQSSICVIDNVTFNAVNSTISNPTISQVCAGCKFGVGSPPCKCIFDASVPAAAEKLGISDPGKFNQYCPGAICLQIDTKTNTSTVVDCESVRTSVPPFNIFSETPSWVWILVVVILIIGIFVIFSVSYHRRNEVIIYPENELVSVPEKSQDLFDSLEDEESPS